MVKSIKLFILIQVFTFISISSQAQNSWEIIYDTDIINAPSAKLSIDNNGNYFVGISSDNVVGNSIEGKYSIFKINPDGVFIDSVEFMFDFNEPITRYYKSIIRNDTLFLFGIRSSQIDNNTSVVTAIYDSGLNYIDSSSYQLPINISTSGTSDIIDINGEFVMVTTINIDSLDSPINGFGFFKFDQNLDSLSFSFSIAGFAISFSMTKSYHDDIIIPSIGWGYNPIDTGVVGGIGFAFFSSDSLQPLFTRQIPSYFLHNNVSMKQYPDSNYIVSAEHAFFSQKNVGVFKISNDFEILDSIVISSSPIPYPNTTFGQNLDFTDPNAIYFGSTENVQGSTASPFPNHIRITKLDSNFNVVWEKFYGGDANYFCYTVKATEDGGCIVLATRFDFENDPDPNHRGTYILKLGPDGIITGIEETGFEVKEVLVYPNPGKELNIATGYNNYSLTLFDMTGKAVYSSKNLSRDSQHQLSFLPAGLYIYRVTAQNGLVLDSGKWVKE